MMRVNSITGPKGHTLYNGDRQADVRRSVSIRGRYDVRVASRRWGASDPGHTFREMRHDDALDVAHFWTTGADLKSLCDFYDVARKRSHTVPHYWPDDFDEYTDTEEV